MLSGIGTFLAGYTGLGAVVLRRSLPLASEREQTVVAAVGGVVFLAAVAKLLR